MIIVTHPLVRWNESTPAWIPPRPRSARPLRRRGRLSTVSDSFPRRQARTRRFTLGTPRGVTLSPDGARVAFLRSRGGTDAVTCLWTLDVATGQERLVADPRTLEAGSDEDLPPEERARRERAREQAGGIVAYATDRAAALAAFALSGRPHVVDLLPGGAPPRPLDAPGPVVDPRPDPTGHRVAYVSGGALHVHDLASGTTTAVAEPESGTVTYGLAEFVAAEEMDRMRGYWWSPDGESLLVARVDDAPVRRWHIADPANPEREPTVVAYPAAGTPNAESRWTSSGSTAPASTSRGTPAGTSTWRTSCGTPDELLIVVQPRDQRALRVLRVDPATGATALVHEDTDPDWVEIVPGVPARTASGALLWITDDGDRAPPARRRRAGHPADAAGPRRARRRRRDGAVQRLRRPGVDRAVDLVRGDGLRCLTPEPGVHDGRLAGGTLVVARQSLDTDGTVTTVRPGAAPERTITSYAEPPGLEPRVTLHSAGERALRTALLLPSWHRPGTPLPVLMDPYGGPHAQRVVAARGAAPDQPVVRRAGLRRRGRATAAARRAAARRSSARCGATSPHPSWTTRSTPCTPSPPTIPDLDLTRVGIRGWSFGGYLAALAVLRRPDVFHAAVAGAPVTDWTLYDTHYTERYLGHPDTHPDAYARSSLLTDAAKLTRPLLLVHGLADDNVVAAHTLRLSSALLAGGRPHSVLPLSGVTHMTPQEVVAENLLLLQVEFLRDALALAGPPAAG